MSNIRYAIDASTKHKINFDFLFVTKSQYEADWHSTMHTHPFTEIFYITNGEGVLITEEHSFEIKKNDLVIVSPNVSHTEKSFTDKPLEYIVLGVQGLTFLDLDDQDSSVTIFNFEKEKHDILFYLNTILKEAHDKKPEHHIICHNLIEILIFNILRNKQLKSEEDHDSRISKEVYTIKQYIQHHYYENISLEKLSEIVHINRFYLSHSFKEKIGMSPIEYLNHIRIKQAKELLTSTNYSISQIAMIVGFAHQSYFSELFKNFEHVSPSQYRKQAKLNSSKALN